MTPVSEADIESLIAMIDDDHRDIPVRAEKTVVSIVAELCARLKLELVEEA